ncbi:hypothetical protein MYAM1_002922 [Malassezia yamatoensis]|uniref:Saccharopine dehydrogenase NADP binding domain-containing protein n=1 Tax=Malassezia yamatoensis TaxID=253288 RepID=A0AAJ5YTL4_9BASI|nr:hypothetical protein MYAM1_002922 [Malassezia yamatoensis]
MPSQEKEYDVVLYGASGFTGSIVAQYLAEHPQAPKIAFAGRNAAKLRKVRDGLSGVSKARIESIGLMEASASDKASLHRLAKCATVVINTVGPFSLLGAYDLARAVAEEGGGYVDLTGESNVYHEEVQDLHSLAQKTGAVLVPSSGFDSLPFDLSAYVAAKEVKKVLGKEATIGNVLVGFHVEGSMSGGTLASGIAMKNDPIALYYDEPYYLSPLKGKQTTRSYKWKYLPQYRGYGSFSPFTAHNTRVVYRSWGLLEEAKSSKRYGPNFGYEEAELCKSRLTAFIMSSQFQYFPYMLKVPGFAQIAAKVLPPGTGPSLEQQRKGCAKLRTIAEADDGKTRCMSTFSVKGDPGYLKSAAFLAESALTLAFEKKHYSRMAQQGGLLTPATAAPDALIARLTQYAGVTIQAQNVTGQKDLTKIMPSH